MLVCRRADHLKHLCMQYVVLLPVAGHLLGVPQVEVHLLIGYGLLPASCCLADVLLLPVSYC
jgi:hypothetical protein